MFSKLNDINFDILSVLNLKWACSNGASGIRPYHSLSFRIKGCADFIHPNGTTHVETGDIIIVPAFYQYTLQAKEEELIVLHFHSNVELPQNIEVFHSEDVQYFKRKFEELYSTWGKNQNGFVFECKSILYKILSRIEKETSTRNLSKSNEKFHEAIEYIHENFTDKSLTVDFLADMCAMSDTYFRRLFMKNFNTTPLKYINNLKLERAKELLRSGYFTVSEVSEECGFDTVHYFCLFIKKETGLTPSQFLPQHET